MTNVSDLQSKRKTKSTRAKTSKSRKKFIVRCHAMLLVRCITLHQNLKMKQENGNEDKIINVSSVPKYCDWFIAQSKKFQLAHDQQRDIDLVDL